MLEAIESARIGFAEDEIDGEEEKEEEEEEERARMKRNETKRRVRRSCNRTF